MRLLYLHGPPLDSESANVVQVTNMCEAFAKCGADVTLAIGAPRRKDADSRVIAAELLGNEPSFKIVAYRNYSVAGRLNVVGKYFGVRSVLRWAETDLCYVRDPLCLRLAVQAGVPTVFESHNYLLHNRSRLLGRLWERDLLTRTGKSRVVRFVVISEALARFWVEKGVPKEKILVLHDGFNAELFEKQRSREEAREKLRLPMGRRIVVYAGRLGPDRGVEVIIDLARACPDAHFLVLGGPDEQRSLLEQKSRAMGIRNVIWKGYVPHSVVAEYLFAADVLLMLWSWDVPHIRCFSPLKMFEYMAAGRIIVGQDYPTIGEVLRDGTTAYLANPDSLEDLCDKVRQALQEEYPSAMADRVRQMALQDYSWNSRAQKILASLKGLI